MRRGDRATYWVAAAALAQLVAGTLYVSQLYAQRPPEIEQAREAQHVLDSTNALLDRVARLEALGIDGRLKVLEDMKKRMDELQLLAYGQIISIGGLIVMSILQVRGLRSRRRRAEEDDDG
jgi:hypothetical protein